MTAQSSLQSNWNASPSENNTKFALPVIWKQKSNFSKAGRVKLRIFHFYV